MSCFLKGLFRCHTGRYRVNPNMPDSVIPRLHYRSNTRSPIDSLQDLRTASQGLENLIMTDWHFQGAAAPDICHLSMKSRTLKSSTRQCCHLRSEPNYYWLIFKQNSEHWDPAVVASHIVLKDYHRLMSSPLASNLSCFWRTILRGSWKSERMTNDIV